MMRTPVPDTECAPAISYGALQDSGSVKVCTEKHPPFSIQGASRFNDTQSQRPWHRGCLTSAFTIFTGRRPLMAVYGIYVSGTQLLSARRLFSDIIIQQIFKNTDANTCGQNIHHQVRIVTPKPGFKLLIFQAQDCFIMQGKQ
ncbi:hypothetical protein D3M71_03695 [Erwinia billingiae]|nr:hypothetical protein [Erwinia billingiae]